jgi:hypothetical protein
MGLGIFVLGVGDIRDGRRSLHWPAVDGTVLSCRISRHLLAPPRPEIRYGYAFGGSSYVSNRIWPGEILAIMPVMSGRAAQKLAGRFPEGRKVTVRVNPADPTEAALIPGPRKASLWMAVFTTFLVLSIWAPLSMGRFITKNRATKGRNPT